MNKHLNLIINLEEFSFKYILDSILYLKQTFPYYTILCYIQKPIDDMYAKLLKSMGLNLVYALKDTESFDSVLENLLADLLGVKLICTFNSKKYTKYLSSFVEVADLYTGKVSMVYYCTKNNLKKSKGLVYKLDQGKKDFNTFIGILDNLPQVFYIDLNVWKSVFDSKYRIKV